MKKNKNIPMLIFAAVIIILITISMIGVIDENVGMCISLFLVIIFTLLLAGTAHKNELFAIEAVMIIFMVIGIVLFGLNVYNLLKKDSVDFDFQITVTNDQSEKTELFSYEGVNYYSYNVRDIMVNFTDGKGKHTLKEAFQSGYVNLSKIQDLMIPNEGTEGYRIFYDGGDSKYPNSQYSLVMCREDTAVFAPYDYVYNEEICR